MARRPGKAHHTYELAHTYTHTSSLTSVLTQRRICKFSCGTECMHKGSKEGHGQIFRPSHRKKAKQSMHAEGRKQGSKRQKEYNPSPCGQKQYIVSFINGGGYQTKSNEESKAKRLNG